MPVSTATMAHNIKTMTYTLIITQAYETIKI